MADFVICPRCRRQNPADAVFCNRCGVRLLSAGVYYRNRETSSSVGMGQLLLGLGVLILAGLVLGGGAILLLGGTPSPTPTRIAGLPSDSPLPTFSTPSASLAPTPTVLVTLPPTFPSTLPPTLTPSPVPTLPATPTPEPTAAPTPVDCAVASTGADVKQVVLGLENPDSRGPITKTWCIRHVLIHPVSGWGTARLLAKNQVVFESSCLPTACADASTDFVPPYQVRDGKTLRYVFDCYDDPATVDINECTDATADGATLTIDYEAIAGP